MRTYDVIGYALDGDLYCKYCFDSLDESKQSMGEWDKPQAVFAGSEWDYSPCCAICGEEIEVNVIQPNPYKQRG